VRTRVAVFATALAGATIVALGLGVASAYACNTNYWNVSCQYYAPQEGHTKAQFLGSYGEAVNTTFTVYSTILAISVTNGGSWYGSQSINSGGTVYFYPAADKVGCFNNNGGTTWVNCRHFDW